MNQNVFENFLYDKCKKLSELFKCRRSLFYLITLAFEIKNAYLCAFKKIIKNQYNHARNV